MKGKHSNLLWFLTRLTLARGIVLHSKVILLCLLQSQDLALCWQAGWECHFRRLRGSRESPECCGMLQLLPGREGWASSPGSSATPLGNLSSHASVPQHALPFPEPPISEARKITERKGRKKARAAEKAFASLLPSIQQYVSKGTRAGCANSVREEMSSEFESPSLLGRTKSFQLWPKVQQGGWRNGVWEKWKWDQSAYWHQCGAQKASIFLFISFRPLSISNLGNL